MTKPKKIDFQFWCLQICFKSDKSSSVQKHSNRRCSPSPKTLPAGSRGSVDSICHPRPLSSVSGSKITSCSVCWAVCHTQAMTPSVVPHPLFGHSGILSEVISLQRHTGVLSFADRSEFQTVLHANSQLSTRRCLHLFQNFWNQQKPNKFECDLAQDGETRFQTWQTNQKPWVSCHERDYLTSFLFPYLVHEKG